LVAVAWWMVAGPVGQAVEPRHASGAAERYVVRPGDTLWSIARGLAPSEDPRPLVDAIAAANHIDAGSIVPGQALVVPSGG
jgi:LysM repeat protein